MTPDSGQIVVPLSGISRVDQNDDGPARRPRPYRVTVVIAAYTLERWELLCRAVESVAKQSFAPEQVIVCIDHNAELLNRCRREWSDPSLPSGLVVQVIPNEFADDARGRDEHARVHGSSRRFGAGSTRNTALGYASGEIVAFLDDDAEATSEWLEQLVKPYEDPNVVAVGGAPLPRYQTARPRWFPNEFDWVFGCAYAGMPLAVAPLRHLIGANMSARREALLQIGGFQSVDFDDMDMCHRLAMKFPDGRIMYNPSSVVYHYVGSDRVTWRYFWRRCFYVNRQKVRAFFEMGDAANLASERDFVMRILSRQIFGYLRQFLKGDRYAAVQLSASLVGVLLAGLGNMTGRFDLMRRSETKGPV